MNEAVEAAGADHAVTRRRVLAGLGLGAAAGAIVGGGAGAVAGATTSGGLRSETLSFEVACLGAMWREGEKANPADVGDFRAPFLVEGWIYPPGTIAGDGFVPTRDGAIGQWFCRGYTLVDASRPEPHTTSHQDYILGLVGPDQLFPPVALASVGLEGTNTPLAQIATRAVIGGTGDFFGATGQVTQLFFATNTSLFADGTDDPAPCFRFEFDLRLPD